jgi:SAM-dependent methyltransferase
MKDIKEFYYDKLLNIRTGKGQRDNEGSLHYHPYEPTPYHALEELFKRYEVKSSDHIVDFGSGKGRLNFFIHYFYGASIVGVEMNERFYQEAVENKKSYQRKVKKGAGIEFQCCLAENYQVKPQDSVFYFFNPFSVQIFMKIIGNILTSAEDKRREVELVIYYGSEDYLFFLENQTPFELKEEILLPGMSERDPFERFLIYRLAS